MIQKFTMIWMMYILCSLLFSQGDMCNNDFLSCYQTTPQTTTGCNPQGQVVTLQCIIYVPHVMGSASTTLKWFKSDTNNNVETQLTRDSSKYSFINSISTVPEHTSRSGDINVTGLYQDIYTVSIRNFSKSDDGYYWCQLESVTNSSCLIFPQSPLGYIAVDMFANQYCLHSDYLQHLQPLQCALPRNVCSSTPLSSTSNTSESVVGTLIFLVILLIVTLLTTVTVFAVAWIKRKKRHEKEISKNTAELARAIARGDFEFTNAQLFQDCHHRSAEYEDPDHDYCIPNSTEQNVRADLQEMRVDEKLTLQPADKPYERIDSCKLDYMSVYHVPTPDPWDEIKQ